MKDNNRLLGAGLPKLLMFKNRNNLPAREPDQTEYRPSGNRILAATVSVQVDIVKVATVYVQHFSGDKGESEEEQLKSPCCLSHFQDCPEGAKLTGPLWLCCGIQVPFLAVRLLQEGFADIPRGKHKCKFRLPMQEGTYIQGVYSTAPRILYHPRC